MSLQRKINKMYSTQPPCRDYRITSPASPTPYTNPYSKPRSSENELKEDKGKADGSCNRTACQAPLVDEVNHQFMDGNFTGGPRLHYCRHCAREFDKWDFRSGDPVRITRELKAKFA